MWGKSEGSAHSQRIEHVCFVPIADIFFASATVRPNQNVDEFDEASTI